MPLSPERHTHWSLLVELVHAASSRLTQWLISAHSAVVWS
jgi:hypothetical protein